MKLNRAWGATANLEHLLRPIQGLLDDPALTDLNVNGVGEGQAFLRRGRGKERITLPFTLDDLDDIAVNAASLNQGADVADDMPFAEGRLPGGHRVQIARSPATRDDVVALSIRKPKVLTSTVDDLRRQGVFAKPKPIRTAHRRHHPELVRAMRRRDFGDLLHGAAERGLNIDFVGSQRAGKSHVLRSATTSVPLDRRVVTVEDMAEAINLHQPDVVNLFYAKDGKGASTHTADTCVETALRMASQLLIVQELRDGAAFSCLSAAMAGLHVLTTYHANSVHEAPDRKRSMVKMHDKGKLRADPEVMADIMATTDVIFYCEAVGDEFLVTDAHYDPGVQERAADAVEAVSQEAQEACDA